MGQLNLKDVKKSFGAAEIIRGVSLDVDHGEFVVFVGPSGCGKSTLLRMIAGLEEISGGEVRIDDVVVNTLPPVKRGIAMVFQSYALYPHMSVFENIAFPLRVERRPQAEVEQRVRTAASILKLDSRLHFRPGDMSGGQRQRVAIGRAIVREPSVFLFDEPLSNLDASLRAEMRVELVKLHAELGATMIYVTHDQVEAMTMADRIVVLDGGEISQVGTPLELYHLPQNLFVASFIGNPKMNLIKVRCEKVDDAGIEVALPEAKGTINVPVDRRRGTKPGHALTLGIRPEHMTPDKSDLNLRLTADVVEHLGAQTVSYAGMSGMQEPFCAVHKGTAPVRIGQALTVGINAEDCHLFDGKGRAFRRRVDLARLAAAGDI
ncbi:ABC transporter ATP-binding protein [Nitratireductor sp. ZSWI3]|uniref:ABC transporter ATP-binding protein n=1 Tax=Nitratireductor sp. ZSWI3 TaxID=2966359 RepID=UPI00214F90A5|nr:sn-glycerol-3-phosphate ABC transporter ATP-binding protein UgpC [Nitratireductor sp. ZSWI3]MCR4265808.1 sn-glycerol-3-phosphate ABC transporter ATP-binding protein UgpC [Nitratireductor sp. ZSWI3]